MLGFLLFWNAFLDLICCDGRTWNAMVLFKFWVEDHLGYVFKHPIVRYVLDFIHTNVVNYYDWKLSYWLVNWKELSLIYLNLNFSPFGSLPPISIHSTKFWLVWRFWSLCKQNTLVIIDKLKWLLKENWQLSLIQYSCYN